MPRLAAARTGGRRCARRTGAIALALALWHRTVAGIALKFRLDAAT
jgi:hypothetical protein